MQPCLFRARYHLGFAQPGGAGGYPLPGKNYMCQLPNRRICIHDKPRGDNKITPSICYPN